MTQRQLELADARGNIMDWQSIRNYIVGGRATFTLKSTLTGKHYTYRVYSSKKNSGQNWSTNNANLDVMFVSVLAGPDDDYRYIGLLERINEHHAYHFRHTAKSFSKPGSPAFDGFKWAWRHLEEVHMWPDSIEFWHEGSCCVCGRTLTDPESVERGIGPECAGKMGL